MQQENTTEWARLLPKATRAHNRLSHEALMGNADPNEAYNLEHKNLQFEMREEAGKKMALQNAVVTTNQKNAQEQGGVRTYIGRGDMVKRGDRPQYSGSVSLVAAVEGNRVKDSSGKVHNMTTTKPVPSDSESTTIKVRLQGSSQTEDRMRAEFKQYAQTLKTILVENGTMYTSVAMAELVKREPNFKNKIKFGAFVKLFPDMFTMQTAAAGGASKVMLKR